MKITKRLFGTLKDGTQVHCWTMENDRGLRAELLDYGATIRAIEVPARGGRTVDVVLGYDTLEGYTENGGYLDLGKPLMDGLTVPVIIKTLIFG